MNKLDKEVRSAILRNDHREIFKIAKVMRINGSTYNDTLGYFYRRGLDMRDFDEIMMEGENSHD